MRKNTENQLELDFTEKEPESEVNPETPSNTEEKSKEVASLRNPVITELARSAAEALARLDREASDQAAEENNDVSNNEVAASSLNESNKEVKGIPQWKGWLVEEIIADLEKFSESDRKVVKEILSGSIKTNGHNYKDEQSRFDRLILEWWQKKYSFDYNDKNARVAKLVENHQPETFYASKNMQANLDKALLKAARYKMSKSSDNSSQEEIHALTAEQFIMKAFLRPLKENNGEGLLKTKKRLEKKFPDELEYIASLVAVMATLKRQVSIRPAIKKKMFGGATENWFVINNYVLNRTGDPAALEEFWQAVTILSEALAPSKADEKNGSRDSLRTSVLSTVATFRLLQELGYSPRQSHPQEDADKAIDMWMSEKGAVQIKGDKGRSEPLLVKSDELIFPTIEAEGPNGGMLISALTKEEIRGKKKEFFIKVKKYAKHLGKDLSGYYLVIPTKMLDQVTGEPSPELIEFFKNRMQQEIDNLSSDVSAKRSGAKDSGEKIDRRSFWKKLFGL